MPRLSKEDPLRPTLRLEFRGVYDSREGVLDKCFPIGCRPEDGVRDHVVLTVNVRDLEPLHRFPTNTRTQTKLSVTVPRP